MSLSFPNPPAAADFDCDALVIGAGPAGAVISLLLARSGLHTVLVEAKKFPREKVCGGCLNARAVDALRAIGLGETLANCGGAPIDTLEILQDARQCEIALPAGWSLSREVLDAALVKSAIDAGVTFHPQTRAHVLPTLTPDHRQVQLFTVHGNCQASARVVLAADGLGHPSLRQLPAVRSIVKSNSHIGLGFIASGDEMTELCPPARIRMIVGSEGYVGLARCEASRVSLAAAVNPQAVASSGSPNALLLQMLRRAGLAPEAIRRLKDQSVRGTVPLTQTAVQAADHRLLLIGDSASYVEPFTGEGMASAIASAIAAAPLAGEAVRAWNPSIAQRWQRQYGAEIKANYRACRVLSGALRHPRLVRLGMLCLRHQPQIGSAVARWIAT